MSSHALFPPAPSSNELAHDRTLMAADRTLMAWIRTALSMLAFGFTIYKVLDGFAKAGVVFVDRATPQNIGLFLIFLGMLALVMGATEYWLGIRNRRRFADVSYARPAFIMAILMTLVGVVVFGAVMLRLI